MSGFAPPGLDAPRGGGAASAVALSRQLNQQITQAANLQVRSAAQRSALSGAAAAALSPAADLPCALQELITVVVVNFNRMNAVNCCTAYHRIARHVQDQRTPPDAWPAAQQQQLGGLLTQLNQALMQRLDEVQAHNLGEGGGVRTAG